MFLSNNLEDAEIKKKSKEAAVLELLRERRYLREKPKFLE